MRKIGIIGLGGIGETHLAVLTHQIKHAVVTALADPAADARAKFRGRGATAIYRSGGELIDDPAVDAVIVASPDDSHEELVLACLDQGKPVLCEKPLAASPDACARVIAREVALQKKLVHVGYMRRHDAGYREMKAAIQRGVVGTPLLLQCLHRNTAPAPYTGSAVPILNSAVHEIDIVRWLLSTDIVRVTAFCTDDMSSDRTWGVARPLLLVLETVGGAIASIEVFVNARYGYDVRCELVGEIGALALTSPSAVTLQSHHVSGSAVPADYRIRFAEAYREQLNAWIACLDTGQAGCADAWDGYLATLTAHACMEAVTMRRTVTIAVPEKPKLYRDA